MDNYSVYISIPWCTIYAPSQLQIPKCLPALIKNPLTLIYKCNMNCSKQTLLSHIELSGCLPINGIIFAWWTFNAHYHIFNDTSDLHFKDTLHKCLKVHVFYFSVECWIGPWVYMYVCIHFVSKHYIRQFVYTPQAASHHIYTELGHGHINMQLRTVEKISVLCILILSVYAKRLYCNIFS